MNMTNKKYKHVCKFMKRCTVLDTLYPPEKKFSKLRRRLRECILISEKNGRNCYTPLGNVGYIYEKERQLSQNFFIIHPYSEFRLYWEITCVIEFFLSYFFRSILVTLNPSLDNSYKYHILSLFSDLFQTTDVSLRFATGYMDKELQEVVLENRKVFSHTMKMFAFYLDVLGSLPIDFILFVTGGERRLVLSNVVFIKIIKLCTLSRYILHIGKVYNWSDFLLYLVWTIYFNFLVLHTIACLLQIKFGVGYMDEYKVQDPSWSYSYTRVFYTTTCIFFGYEGFRRELVDIWDKFIFCMIVVFLYLDGIVLNSMFIQLLAFVRNSKIFYDEMKQEVQKFLAQECLPKRIHKKTLNYLDFRYCQRYFNEELILNTLSPPLRDEVMRFLCFNLLKRPNSIFKSVPDDMVNKLCTLMKLDYFLPGDIIFKVGNKSRKIYFLYSGSVSVYSPYGKEIMHWYEGQQFGTSAFWDSRMHPVTAVALEMTEVYTLFYSEFAYIARKHPDVMAAVTEAARERVRYVLNYI